MKHTGIALHARKWHRTSPCPYCGTRKLVIERPGRTIGILRLTYWIFRCGKCPGAVMIDAPDGDAKTAIRKWNQYANGQWRKH